MAPSLELGAIRQIARTVRDIEESRRWYRDALGLKHLYSYGNLAFFDCDGLRLFLSEGEGSQQESIIYFRRRRRPHRPTPPFRRAASNPSTPCT